MSSSEFVGWIDYHNRIPFTAERTDILLAELISLTANINRNETHAPFEVLDFMPWLKERETIDVPRVGATTMATAQENAGINIDFMNFKAKLLKLPQQG